MLEERKRLEEEIDAQLKACFDEAFPDNWASYQTQHEYLVHLWQNYKFKYGSKKGGE